MIRLVVAAAVIEREGRILVTKRPEGVHLEGHWEFPGGKCAPGETLEQCILRELREELAVDAVVGSELLSTSHDYVDRAGRAALLQMPRRWRATATIGSRDAMGGAARAGGAAFPPADTELIAMLTRRTTL